MPKRGFTLVEALAAAVLLGVGVTACLTAFSRLVATEQRARETERMRNLALDKLEELVATGTDTTAQDGDFRDVGETRYRWQADVQPTPTANLNAVTVIVERTDAGDRGPRPSVTTLRFVPPVATEGTP